MYYDDKYVYGLGGNQNDQVSIERFPRSVIYSYTWPAGITIPDNVIDTVVVANTSTNVKET
jgi:hypothetical protein